MMKHLVKAPLAMAIVCLGLTALTAQAETQPTTNTGTQQMSPAIQNQMSGDAFLSANKKKQGVVTLNDGLQYKILKQGTGDMPTDSDVVTVNYKGTLVNGQEFDSSYKRGEPATFPVAGVIPGWTEALKLMKVGSKWELYIPASLAYGEQGAPPAIGPNETLIFEVELLGVKKS
jgi:FKBP-type peptidyl-prolyl cis-trans isomerase FklB